MPQLTLDALQVLDAIDRRGSFAAAAEELFRVPSAITYTIQKLEQDLRVELFDRSGHRARLTGAGRELLEHGRPLLRAAAELEARVQRIAKGWEPVLSIAYDDTLPVERLLLLSERFYALGSGTRLKLSAEVLGGGWDALLAGRAELAIGVSGEGHGGYALRPMGRLEFVFCVAPHHPLAVVAEPLRSDALLAHRAVAVADSARNLPPRTAGLLSGQDILTVPTLAAKQKAQELGLGVGYLPRRLAAEAIAAGRLLAKEVDASKPSVEIHVAWRTDSPAKALRWWIETLAQETWTEWLGG